MIEDFELADCWKNIADPHEDFGLMTEWCAWQLPGSEGRSLVLLQ
jgi:hypothetical protein